jgi:RNA polymerase sigma-70 factor, ECF subfamily
MRDVDGPKNLATAFRRTYRGTPYDPGGDGPLDAALSDFTRRGREAWPDVPLEASTFVSYLGERAPLSTAPLAWLAEQRAADLFLACACCAGLPKALDAFERVFMSRMDAHLRGLRPKPELVTETKQELRTKLFVGVSGGPPKILQYAGEGALSGWVRIAAVRTALNLMNASNAGQPSPDEADEVARAIVPSRDPELELIRETYKEAFVVAFREAIAALSRRDRALLRFTFVEHLTPARIGAMYDVHRTTAMRWIDAAQAQVLAETRSRMMKRLQLSPSECDGVLAVVKSRMEITITSLFQSAS